MLTPHLLRVGRSFYLKMGQLGLQSGPRFTSRRMVDPIDCGMNEYERNDALTIQASAQGPEDRFFGSIPVH